MRDQITEGTGDILGQILKRTQGFRGRGRLTQIWLSRCQQQTQTRRVRMLPGGGRVLCDLSIPYEAMVWLEKEEQTDLEILRRLLQPGERFVDCGANIGLWSLVGASAVGANGSVVAFEPNPGTRNKLARNRELSGMTNLDIQPYALSSARGTVNFACAPEHNLSQITPQTGSDKIVPDTNGETIKTISVQTIALDEALDAQPPAGERQRVSGCKIDVEGHEMPALRGAERMLREDRPWLCVEFNTLLSGITRLGEWDVHRFLCERGYRAYRFEDALTASAHPEHPALPDEWQTTGYCNLYYRVERP